MSADLMWMVWTQLVPRNAAKCSSFYMDPKRHFLYLRFIGVPPAAGASKRRTTFEGCLDFSGSDTHLYVKKQRSHERLWEGVVPMGNPKYHDVVGALIRDKMGLDFPNDWDALDYPDLPW